MYLSKIHIQNFRCFDGQGIDIAFQPGVNVIIGENNTGKSTLIDALRIAFSLGPGRRSISITPQDFHKHWDGTVAEEIAFDLTFSDLTPDEESSFYEMWVVDSSEAQFHIRSRLETVSGAIERPKTSYWGGEHEGQPVSPETLEYVNHIFLDALRDAERYLRPGRRSYVGKLLRSSITEDKDKARILSHVQTANRAIMGDPKIRQVGDLVNRNLGSIEGTRLRQRIQLGLTPPDFSHVTNSLSLLISLSGGHTARATLVKDEWDQLLSVCSSGADILQAKAQTVADKVTITLSDIPTSDQQKIDPGVYAELLARAAGNLGLEQNGLGYNNLIFMGTALGDLQEWKKIATDSYNALLIEEPEAHLHPQLQDLVFAFLARVSTDTAQNPIQVFVTSHSPTLTSRASLDSLILLYENSGRIKSFPVQKCVFDDDSQKADLMRYLDVTKSQLFFAKGIVLVEGISETLLLPVFARRLERRLDYNAVEVVNIGGTSFAPFARLFNSDDPANRLDIPCAILTDDDRCTNKDDDNRLTDENVGISFTGKTEKDAEHLIAELDEIRRKMQRGIQSHRATKALTLAGGNLIVKVAYKTFEYELALHSENIPSMVKALKTIHPKIAKGLGLVMKSPLLSNEHKAICLWLAVRDAKAEFAQRLAALLDDYDESGVPKEHFTVPNYIAEAIKHIAPVKTPLLPHREDSDALT